MDFFIFLGGGELQLPALDTRWQHTSALQQDTNHRNQEFNKTVLFNC